MANPRTAPTRVRRWIEVLLWMVAALALGWVSWSLASAEIYQARARRSFETVLAQDHLAPPDDLATALADSPSAPKEVVGLLEIPRLGLSEMVAHGADQATLRRAVGFIPGTARPGRPGNVGLAGHRDTHFRPLEAIEPSDEIVLTTEEGRYTYRVEWTRVVDPESIEVLDPTANPALTLVTCYPFSYVGPAPRRFIVRARQVQEAPGAPVGGAIN